MHWHAARCRGTSPAIHRGDLSPILRINMELGQALRQRHERRIGAPERATGLAQEQAALTAMRYSDRDRRFFVLPRLFRRAISTCTPAKSSQLLGPDDPAGTRAAALFHFHEQTELTTLFVGDLPFSATEESVRTLFAPHGPAESLAFDTYGETGRAGEHDGGQQRY